MLKLGKEIFFGIKRRRRRLSYLEHIHLSTVAILVLGSVLSLEMLQDRSFPQFSSSLSRQQRFIQLLRFWTLFIALVFYLKHNISEI
jgi:hypothetical protein